MKKNESGSIQYGFSLKKDDTGLENLILSELSLVRKFVEYFRQETSDIFKKMNQVPLNIAEKLGKKFYEKPKLPPSQLTPSQKLRIFRGFDFIDEEEANIAFTPRELDCIRLRLDHQTAPEIADQLDLSVRTVEHYLDNVRTKLYCDRKTNYVAKLKKLRDLGILRFS